MQKFLFIFFCAILFWAPIPLGSHRIWSAALLEFLIAILFGLWLLTLKSNVSLPKALTNNKIIITLLAQLRAEQTF